MMLLYGDAFWPTYTTGDNTNLIATDSMKNFIQRETLNFTGNNLESYTLFLAEKFLRTYPQTEGMIGRNFKRGPAEQQKTIPFVPLCHKIQQQRTAESGKGPLIVADVGRSFRRGLALHMNVYRY